MVLLVVFKMRFRAIVSALCVGARERRRRRCHWHAWPDRHVRSRAGRAIRCVVFLMQLEMSSTVHAHRRRSVVLLLVASEMSGDMRRACARPELARLHAEQVLQELLLGLEQNLDRARRGKQSDACRAITSDGIPTGTALRACIVSRLAWQGSTRAV